jgi:osmotically-inducible protein OsmY
MCESVSEHSLEQVEAHLRQRLRGRVWALRVLIREGGVVLQGQALSYYVKQLGQQIAMQELRLTVAANEIEVRPTLAAQNASGDPG